MYYVVYQYIMLFVHHSLKHLMKISFSEFDSAKMYKQIYTIHYTLYRIKALWLEFYNYYSADSGVTTFSECFVSLGPYTFPTIFPKQQDLIN